MPTLPEIDGSEKLDVLAVKLRRFFVEAVDAPHDWDELWRENYAESLRPLVRHLTVEVHHNLVVCALLALKWQFAEEEKVDERGVCESRGLACELVAWRFITHLSHDEALAHLCSELPPVTNADHRQSCHSAGLESAYHDDLIDGYFAAAPTESPLLGHALDDSFHADHALLPGFYDASQLINIFSGLDALEIAVVADAKKFLRQSAIQRIIDGIWRGDIVFWETLGAHSTKRATVYRKSTSDPFCRLRVPLYLKVFEAWFFIAFLFFYYLVLIQTDTSRITFPEVMLYIWIASFAYNEVGEFSDAGLTFYAADFWSLWDVGIIVTGLAFFITRLVGLARGSDQTTGTAFDILSVEALFLVPRLCSLLSLHPYYGMLIPALKAMTKDFIKFLGIVVILYLGFTTCFAFLARGTFTFQHTNWILIKVFFGSSYLGFELSEKISPVFAPVLMVIFVALTNILLVTSIISLLSNTLTKFMQHARDEYYFVYAVYVLEASTSNRLTYFLPPLNLVPLLCLRPLRICAPAQALRTARILLLKATHWPFVVLIFAYEAGRLHVTRARRKRNWARRGVPTWTGGMSSRIRPAPSPVSQLRRPRSRMAAHTWASAPLDEQARDTRSSAIGGDVHGLAYAGRMMVASGDLATKGTPARGTSTRAMTPTTATISASTLAEVAAAVAGLHERIQELTQTRAATGVDRNRKSRQENGDDRDEANER